MNAMRVAHLLLFLCAALPSQAQPPNTTTEVPTSLRAIFIGNSLTYYNDMPSMAASLSHAANDSPPLHATSITMPLWRADRMMDLRQVRLSIAENRWDFVVLQVNPNVEDPVRLADLVKQTVAAANKSGAKTILYVTWKLPKGTSRPRPWIDAWGAAAIQVGALHAPVAEAWEAAFAAEPSIPLLDPDGVHPSPLGSYIAACVVYLLVYPSRQSCPLVTVAGASAPQVEAAARSAGNAVFNVRGAK